MRGRIDELCRHAESVELLLTSDITFNHWRCWQEME